MISSRVDKTIDDLLPETDPRGPGELPDATANSRRRLSPGHRVRRERSRSQILWRNKWLIAVVAIVMAVLAAGYASRRPASYTAEATIQVSLLQTTTVGEQNALAANELAAQYAQLATSDPVLDAARKKLTPADNKNLSNVISATPVNSYNIIGVSATSAHSSRAARQAVAVAESLKAYVDSLVSSALAKSANTDSTRLKELDNQIADVQSNISLFSSEATGTSKSASLAAAKLASAQSLLGSLVSVRENIYVAPQRSLAQSQPQLTVMNEPTRGSEQSKHVYLYGLVALVIAIAVLAQLAVLIGRARDGQFEHSDGDEPQQAEASA